MNLAAPNLGRLDLSRNRLASLEGVSLSRRLRWLSVAGNQVTSLEPLRELEVLEVRCHRRLRWCGQRKGWELQGGCGMGR